MYYHVLPCIAIYYHVLPCIAMFYHVLPRITMYCHVLPCITMYCHVLPCIAMYYLYLSKCRMDYLDFSLPFAVGICIGHGAFHLRFVFLFFLFSFAAAQEKHYGLSMWTNWAISYQKMASDAALVFQRHGTALDIKLLVTYINKLNFSQKAIDRAT